MNGKKREQKYENCQTGDGKSIYTKKKKVRKENGWKSINNRKAGMRIIKSLETWEIKARMEMKRNNNKGY